MSSDNSERSLNQAQLSRLSTELSKQQLTQFSEIINGILDKSQVEIGQLQSFDEEEMLRFIHEYEKLDPKQRKLVRLRQRLNEKNYYHIESCGKINSNEQIVNFLKALLYDEKIKECATAADLIAKNIKFDNSVKEEQAVEVMFRQIKDLLARLPEGMEKKPKRIAKAIIKLLPDHFWIREKDLCSKPELRNPTREELKRFILSCIPPTYLRDKAKALAKFERRGRKVETKMIAQAGPCKVSMKAICDDPEKAEKEVRRTYMDKYLCDWCYRFGHHQSRCHGRNKPQPSRPSDDILNSNWEAYISRKREERDKKNMRKIGESEGAGIEKSVASDSHLSQEEMDFEEEDFFNGVKVVKTVKEEEDEEEGRFIYLSALEPVESDLDMVEFSQVMGDAEISVRIDKTDQMFVALLDSGAFKSAINSRLKKYCNKILKLRKPLRVKAAGGEVYKV
eukprot:snap_masked-scaffold_4-processed-gene-19.21-mRNA-1 protein AED:1.00 eAED:1.00 QI:0/-1/0/0/-1/1/1/0/450